MFPLVFSDLMRRFKNCGACHIFPSGGRGVFVEPGGRATFHPQGLWEKWSAFFAKVVSRNGPFRLTTFGVCRAGGRSCGGSGELVEFVGVYLLVVFRVLPVRSAFSVVRTFVLWLKRR